MISFFGKTSGDTWCLDGQLPTQDRYIFFIGCPLVLIATSTLIIGSLKFKELRQQPGDIILGIAVSDFILALHWLSIAIWPEDANDGSSFCTSTGAVGTFAGLSEYLYNIAFNIYLIVSLRNALKQDKIPKKSFHAVVLSISLGVLIALLYLGKIGKTLVKTCSIKSRCETDFFNYIGPLIVTCYVLVGFYTYYYVHKNAPKCKNSHSKRAEFLMYYLRYIVASTIIYMFISATNFLSPVLNVDHPTSVFTPIVNSLYNASKLASPLILSFIRFRDPLIRKLIMKTLAFYKRTLTNAPLTTTLMNNEAANQQQAANQVISNENDENDNNDQFIFNQLQSNRKIEITYTLLSCVLYGDLSQRNSIKDLATITDRKSKNLYKHERMFQVNDDIVKAEIPKVRHELNKNNINVMPGTLKAYAPRSLHAVP